MSIYQHRSLRPSGPPEAYNSGRIQDALDVIKQDFDALATELSASRGMREKYEDTINAQVDELNTIRQALHELEQRHGKVRQQYEEELRGLRAELYASKQSSRTSAASSVFPTSEPFRDRAPLPPPSQREQRDLPAMREKDRGGDSDRERGFDSRDIKRIKESPISANLIGPASTPSMPPPPPLPPLVASASQAPTPRIPRAEASNAFLADAADPSVVPPQWKKEGADWFALYNPSIPRSMEVGLVHSFLHETVVCCVQFSYDGKWLATGCNRTAQIYDVHSGHKICVLMDENTGKNEDLYIRSVRFSPDGKYLATGAEDKRIRIWDIAKRSIRNVFEGHQQEIYSIEFSYDGRLCLSGSGDRTVRIWDMDSPSTPARVLSVTDSDPSLPSPPPPIDAGVTSVAISPEGLYVAAGCVDAIVRIWSVSTGALVDQLRGHQDSVYSVVFTKDGTGIVSGSLDGTLKFWDLRTAKSRRDAGKQSIATTTFVGHKDYVLSVGVSHDSQWIVSGSKDRGIQFWDSHGIVHTLIQGHKNSVISISPDPTGNLLASGSGDNFARIWSYNVLN
ncbi:unnamed protein product [Mycena citricolor]|uniref:Transcriptional repressor Tup1 N-terminal domain-containing protein n=1 Tax=Mycena citricolor TaxID=2018698 RepID=A0AAD2HDA2_9AGAR|nr:unnamed protein product [Mycena citricolor]